MLCWVFDTQWLLSVRSQTEGLVYNALLGHLNFSFMLCISLKNYFYTSTRKRSVWFISWNQYFHVFFNKFILDFDESCLASNFIMAILGCHLQCRNRKIQYKEVKSVLCIRRPKNWSFSFGISPSNKYSELISFRINWFDLLAVQGTLKSYLQHHSSKASILLC